MIQIQEKNMSVAIPSIIVPSDEMLINKERSVIYGGVSPIEEDNSTWLTVIYQFWHIHWVEKDITERLNKLEMTSLDEVDNAILNIKEGMRILVERLNVSPYYNEIIKEMIPENHRIVLSFKEIQIYKKRNEIDEKKKKLIKRMEKFRQDLETHQVKAEEIDKEKKEIQKETSEIKKMGAEKDCMRQIGKDMKKVYREISKLL